MGTVGSPQNQAPLKAATHTPPWAEEDTGFAWGGGAEMSSLLAQLPGNIATLEALQVVEAACQPTGSFTHALAPVGQWVCAARLQPLRAAQL